MRKYFSTVIFFCTILFSVNAYSDIYFGIQGGYSSVAGSLKDFKQDIGKKITKGSHTYGIYAGYDFVDNPLFSFGLEANYMHASKFYGAKLTALPVYITGTVKLPFAGFSGFIKAGYAYTTTNSWSYKDKEWRQPDKWKPAITAGLKYTSGVYQFVVQPTYIEGVSSNHGYALYTIGIGVTV